jgi:hypothetical protein
MQRMSYETADTVHVHEQKGDTCVAHISPAFTSSHFFFFFRRKSVTTNFSRLG